MTDRIDRVIMADERDHTSEGVVLARKHEVIGFPHLPTVKKTLELQ